MDLSVGKLRGPINSYKQVLPPLSHLNLWDIDVKIADGVGFKALLFPPGDALLGKTYRQSSMGSCVYWRKAPGAHRPQSPFCAPFRNGLWVHVEAGHSFDQALLTRLDISTDNLRCSGAFV